MRTVRQFLADHPDAFAYGKRLLQAIRENKISLKGRTPYEILQHAYQLERRGWEESIDRWFEEEDQRAEAKFEKEYKEEERKRNAKK
jgi:hypothetical protein